MPAELLLREAREVEGILSTLVDTLNRQFIEALPRLRVISQMAAGVDNIDLRAATEAGVPVGHTPDVLTETTADTAFALMAAVVRRLVEGREKLARGDVEDWDPEFLLGGDLWGTTLGIVGLGRIGSAVARRAQGFGMQILYTTSAPRQVELEWRSFDDLMAEADHVVLSAPLTHETRHMVDAEALARMRDGGTLVNIARGGLVDHDALLAEARTGRIAAGLDVTEPEPLPPDHPLLHLPNVLVVPHLGSSSVRTRRAMVSLAIENLRAGLTGQRLRACANPEVYERIE